MTTKRTLELLHMDLFGLIAYISIGGSKYCLVIVDDYSRFTWVFFLQEKSQTQETLKKFLRQAQNEFGLRIKKIRSDNERSSRTLKSKDFLRRASSICSLLPTHLNKMTLWIERIELLWIWKGPCLKNTRHWISFGWSD
jgi:hypothetical protein